MYGCTFMEKVLDELSFIGIDEKTDEYKNPELHQSLQNKLGKHLIECSDPRCIKSKEARIEVEIMKEDGTYLRGKN